MFVVVLALLAAVNIALWFGPAGIGVLVGPAVAVVLVGIARRCSPRWW